MGNIDKVSAVVIRCYDFSMFACLLLFYTPLKMFYVDILSDNSRYLSIILFYLATYRSLKIRVVRFGKDLRQPVYLLLHIA